MKMEKRLFNVKGRGRDASLVNQALNRAHGKIVTSDRLQAYNRSRVYRLIQ